MSSLADSAEVVVVGAGIVGAACAEALAREGVDVLLLEREAPTAGASGACEGNIMLADKQPGPELDLGRLALDAYERLVNRVAANDIELERKGALLVDTSAEEHATTAALVAQVPEAELIDGGALRELEPALAEGLYGGAFFPGDLQVWPMKVVFALLRTARDHGARIRFPATVERIAVTGGRVSGVLVDGKRIGCDVVVVAAGASSGALFPLPLKPRKGQIVVTERASGFLRRKVLASNYMSTVHTQTTGYQIATVLESTRAGNVLVGSSRVDNDASSTPDLKINAEMLRAALQYAPGLVDLRVLRTYAGARAALPDALPAIGRSNTVDGLVLATGHEGAGICHGPITGELVADLVLGRAPPLDLAPFDPDRFG